jgi:hypothetical protein
MLPHHIITLVDSNFAKTLSTINFRPPNDANDTYIGLDNAVSGAASSAQLALGSGSNFVLYRELWGQRQFSGEVDCVGEDVQCTGNGQRKSDGDGNLYRVRWRGRRGNGKQRDGHATGDVSRRTGRR